MKPTRINLLATSLAVFSMTQASHAAAISWDAGGGSGNTAWNYNAGSFVNWSDNATPAGDDVTFTGTGAVSGTSTVTSSLDAAYNINKLTAYNTGSNYQNFDLGGFTLTSASHVAFGFNTGGVSSATNATMKNGSFAMTSGNFIVGGSSGGANAGLATTVDFSNLTSTSIGNSSSLFVVGYYSAQASSNLTWGNAAMTLSSGNNTLTATKLLVGHTDGGTDAFANNSKNATLTLKGATDIKADTVSIAYGKRSTSSIATSGTTAVTLHGTSGGSSAITTFTVGGASLASGVGIISGTADFSGGSLDGAITTLNLATGGILTSGNVSANSGRFITGTSGTLDVTNVKFGGAVTSTNATVVALDIRGGTFRFDTWTTGAGSGGSGSAKSLLLNAGTLSAIDGNANTISGLDIFQIAGTGAVTFGQTTGGTGALDITASAITLGANADVTVNADTTLNGSISASGNGLTKEGAATLTLASANHYTGDTTISAGTLALGAAGSLASTKIIVGDAGSSTAKLDVSAKTAGFTIASAQELSGIGIVDANDGSSKYTVTLADGATHAVGNASENSGVGKQTIDGNLSYSAGSIFEWNLNGNTADSGDRGIAGGYDAVDGTGTLTVDATEDTGAIFRIVLGSGVDLGDGFWSTPYASHTWSNIFSGFSGLTGGFDNSNIEVTGQSISGIGSFTISGTSLTFTAVPEPTSALAGLLIAAGLLRRRRA